MPQIHPLLNHAHHDDVWEETTIITYQMIKASEEK